jgi:hypothetical protein
MNIIFAQTDLRLYHFLSSFREKGENFVCILLSNGLYFSIYSVIRMYFRLFLPKTTHQRTHSDRFCLRYSLYGTNSDQHLRKLALRGTELGYLFRKNILQRYQVGQLLIEMCPCGKDFRQSICKKNKFIKTLITKIKENEYTFNYSARSFL